MLNRTGSGCRLTMHCKPPNMLRQTLPENMHGICFSISHQCITNIVVYYATRQHIGTESQHHKNTNNVLKTTNVHHHHHHPRISSRRKYWTKLQLHHNLTKSLPNDIFYNKLVRVKIHTMRQCWLTDWLTEVLYYDIWQTADEITMHDRYSLSNKINYSLQFSMHQMPKGQFSLTQSSTVKLR